MPKVKICFFVPFYPLIKGGAEYQSKIIATELQKKGYEIVYISEGHKQETVSFEDGFKVYRVKANPSVMEKSTFYKGFMDKVIDILKQENPDIVYQRILNSFTYRLSKFAHQNKLPFILHIADNYSIEFSGKKGFLKREVFKKILKQAPNIICQTQYQYQKIQELGHTPKIVIPNMHPILIEEVHEKNRNSILWIGNARPVKQLELFLKLADKFKASGYTFNVIGKLPTDNYGKELLVGIKEHKNIIYHGSQSNEYINKLLQNSGLLVNTSISEGFSNTFIQAWMCGTPVLALNSDPDGVMQLNDIGIDCKGNETLLSIGLEKILKSSTYDEICKKALETAKTLFSTDENIAKFDGLLEEIASG